MHCPRLSELPPPPEGKTGWPWTVETPPLPPARPDGSPWPRISIVTPSYNQGQFIEETIRSVLLQGYPDLEYIVIDGGSTDQSVEIIKRYEFWLSYWVSEKDRGQSDAINKGFSRTSGLLMNWLNSDDYLLPNALETIASVAMAVPEADLISGFRLLSHDGVIRTCQTGWDQNWTYYLAGYPDFPQDATYFSREAWNKAGGIDERFTYGLDVAYFYRALRMARQVAMTSAPISVMRVYPDQKTHLSDPYKRVERELLGAEYSPRSMKSRFVDRLARTRFHRVAALLPLLLFRKKMKTFCRVEYRLTSKGWLSRGM